MYILIKNDVVVVFGALLEKRNHFYNIFVKKNTSISWFWVANFLQSLFNTVSHRHGKLYGG